MKEIIVEATVENIEAVNEFIRDCLKDENVPDEILMNLDLAVEEIYINIARYAYNPSVGKAKISCQVTGEPLKVCIEFLDEGIPYNPLEAENPDITLSAEEREIGGLGVFLVKELMDEIEYQFKDNKNILIIKKAL